MSKKDVEIYYKQIVDQYNDMLKEIKDFEEEAKTGLIEPERLDQIKETIKPLMQNYERISYIMFLLNQPVKKKKHKTYMNQNKKALSKLNKVNNLQSVIEENKEVIKKINNK